MRRKRWVKSGPTAYNPCRMIDRCGALQGLERLRKKTEWDETQLHMTPHTKNQHLLVGLPYFVNRQHILTHTSKIFDDYATPRHNTLLAYRDLETKEELGLARLSPMMQGGVFRFEFVPQCLINDNKRYWPVGCLSQTSPSPLLSYLLYILGFVP